MKVKEVSHVEIEKIVQGVKCGMISPSVMVYVFELHDKRFMGVNASSFEEAERYIKAKYFNYVAFVGCEPITYHGFTVGEILKEAKRRGIKGE